jgi:hypothetical protein
LPKSRPALENTGTIPGGNPDIPLLWRKIKNDRTPHQLTDHWTLIPDFDLCDFKRNCEEGWYSVINRALKEKMAPVFLLITVLGAEIRRNQEIHYEACVTHRFLFSEPDFSPTRLKGKQPII